MNPSPPPFQAGRPMRARYGDLALELGFALVFALATALAASLLPFASSAPRPARAAPEARTLPDEATIRRTRLGLDLERHALNGLLVPLLEPDGSPRWAEPSVFTPCHATSRILVDGRPPTPGAELPAVPFTVRWDMSNCQLFDGTALTLSGKVDVRVTAVGDEIRATVVPQRLSAMTPWRAYMLGEPFVTATRLSR